jgi:hypothetical protein
VPIEAETEIVTEYYWRQINPVPIPNPTSLLVMLPSPHQLATAFLEITPTTVYFSVCGNIILKLI